MRAQVILATYYCHQNLISFARKVQARLDSKENKTILISIKGELAMTSTKEFWEVSERGANFTYLEQHLRRQLDTFYSWFTEAKVMSAQEWDNFMESKEGMELKVSQQLMNFDTEIAVDDDDDHDGRGNGNNDDDASDLFPSEGDPASTAMSSFSTGNR
ncbi:hypothetical protein Pelo_9723 [Pelomyxa schiedti]|nr:hypothetical protein Pelo_9723 [Pelomyxa schiedti]